MPDQSHLDDRYFVDNTVYNCPFCNRRNVSYYIYDKVSFDWTEDKPCHVYFARCGSCSGKSMHLSFRDLKLYGLGDGRSSQFSSSQMSLDALDDQFFYSVPTSFFVLDQRIPPILRALLTEAEGSLKSNFLTGASACARKIIYELGSIQEVDGDNYEDRIKSLKNAHPEVAPTYFDTLLTIQKLTSSMVHENSYDGWNSNHLKLILATLRKILHELYVEPALRADNRKLILDLTKELLPGEVSVSERGDDKTAI